MSEQPVPAPSTGPGQPQAVMDRTQRVVPVLVTVLASLVVTTASVAQQADVAATPPDDAAVYRLTADRWDEPICAGAREWTYIMPAGEWIAFPVGWFAIDEVTARANWESMRFEVAVDGRTLEVPVPEEWAVDVIHVECPARTITGVAVSPIIYLPPLTAERRYDITRIFADDVDDGRTTVARGTRTTKAVRLRPQS